MISHVYEVSVGIDCGGEKKKHPWSVHGCFPPRFVYQNALHRMVGHVALYPSELMGFFPSARQCHPDAKSDLRVYGRAAHFGSSGSAPCPIASRRFFGLERAKSKGWSWEPPP